MLIHGLVKLMGDSNSPNILPTKTLNRFTLFTTFNNNIVFYPSFEMEQWPDLAAWCLKVILTTNSWRASTTWVKNLIHVEHDPDNTCNLK